MSWLNDLLWFSGITWDTPLRDIGWSYVFVLALIVLLIYCIKQVGK
jgi:hypothetical protein